MLLRLSAVVLLGVTLAWSQSAPPGCANRPASQTPTVEPGKEEKKGFKQRMKDQFSSGCVGAPVNSCWGKGQKEPGPTTAPPSTEGQSSSSPSTQQPDKQDPLAFPEQQSRQAEEAARGQMPRQANPNESSSRQTGPAPGEIEVMEMKRFDPHQAEKDVEVGDFYYKRKNYKAAIARYREAVELNPAYPQATFKLADTLENVGQYDQAALFYSEYVRQFPKGEQFAAAQEALGRLAPRLQADSSRLKLMQAERDLRAGESLLAQRNYPDAVGRFCEAAAAAPGNARAIFRLAQALEATGEFAAAYANFEDYLKLEPDGAFAPDARREIQRLAPQLQQGTVIAPSAGTHP